MVNTILRVSFVALLAAALGAQSRSTPEETAKPLPLSLDDFTALVGSGVADLHPQGDTDYSPRALFMQEHGDFMLKYKRFEPMISVSFTQMPSYEVKGEQGHFNIYRSSADIRVPFYLGPDAYLTLGAYGHNRHYQVKNSPKVNDENLSAAGVHLGVGMFLDRDVLLEVEASPGVWSDMDGSLKHQDYDMPASALMTWRFGDDAYFKAGFRYNQVYKEAPWLPYLGVSWALSDVFRVDVLLPEHVELSWWPDSGLGVLLGTQIDGAQYRVRTNVASGRQRANAQVQEIVVYAGVLSRFTDNLSLMARGGAAVAGDYHLTNGDTTLGYADGTLDPGLFLEVTFGIDF